MMKTVATDKQQGNKNVSFAQQVNQGKKGEKAIAESLDLILNAFHKEAEYYSGALQAMDDVLLNTQKAVQNNMVDTTGATFAMHEREAMRSRFVANVVEPVLYVLENKSMMGYWLETVLNDKEREASMEDVGDRVKQIRGITFVRSRNGSFSKGPMQYVDNILDVLFRIVKLATQNGLGFEEQAVRRARGVLMTLKVSFSKHAAKSEEVLELIEAHHRFNHHSG